MPQVEFECDGEAPADPEAVAELGADMWVEEHAAVTTPHPASTVLEASPMRDNLVDPVSRGVGNTPDSIECA